MGSDQSILDPPSQPVRPVVPQRSAMPAQPIAVAAVQPVSQPAVRPPAPPVVVKQVPSSITFAISPPGRVDPRVHRFLQYIAVNPGRDLDKYLERMVKYVCRCSGEGRYKLEDYFGSHKISGQDMKFLVAQLPDLSAAQANAMTEEVSQSAVTDFLRFASKLSKSSDFARLNDALSKMYPSDHRFKKLHRAIKKGHQASSRSVDKIVDRF